VGLYTLRTISVGLYKVCGGIFMDLVYSLSQTFSSLGFCLVSCLFLTLGFLVSAHSSSF